MPASESIAASRSPLDAYQRRVTAFALFNLSVLAAVYLLHMLFVELLGPPRAALLVVLGVLFAGQAAILLWLQTLREPPSHRADRGLAVSAIAVMVLGAFSASLWGEGEEHHYFVLMLPAIVMAAFRFGLAGALLTAFAAGGAMVFDVWLWFRGHPSGSTSEYFETATVCLLFVVVGLLVHVLADDLRRHRRQLAGSLAELERTRDRLVEEERLAAVGRLSSAIAHEIRNPVAMIASSLAAASRGGLDEPARAQMFAVAAEEATRLERLTSDFLSYAHTRTPERQTVSAAETLGVVAELARARAGEASVSVRVESTSAEGRFDPFLVHQALLNLAINAIQATPAGGDVRLSAARESEALILRVENSGAALAPEAAARVFEPFFTTRPGGTGLGLAIARRIARAHGGDALLERNQPGHVTFALRLVDASEGGD